VRGRDTPARTRVEKEPPAGRIRGREEEKEKDDAEYENHRGGMGRRRSASAEGERKKMSETEKRLVSDNTAESAREGREREKDSRREGIQEEERETARREKERKEAKERKGGRELFRVRRNAILSLLRTHARGEGEARPKDEELCKKRDKTGRIPRDKRRRGRRRRRNGGTKEDHAGDYNINKQMSLEAGEFAIQSGTGGGREAESPSTNLEGLPRTLAPSLDLSSPSPACLTATKFLPLAFRLGASSLFLSLFLSPPPIRDLRFYVYKTRRARIDAKTTMR